MTLRDPQRRAGLHRAPMASVPQGTGRGWPPGEGGVLGSAEEGGLSSSGGRVLWHALESGPSTPACVCVCV